MTFGHSLGVLAQSAIHAVLAPFNYPTIGAAGKVGL